MRDCVCAVIACGLLAALGPGHARAGDRMDEFELEIEALKREIRDMKATDSEMKPDTADADVDGEGPETGQIPDLDPGWGMPKLTLRGFADVAYQAQWSDPSTGKNESQNNFVIGGMDLFVTSKLSSGFGFLSETLFGFHGADAEVDVERLLLMYEHRDWLKLNAGRGHTALGYWNQYFHHGKWLQTTVDRPLLYQFEDDGGILPVHFVGLEVFGNVDAGCGLLSYSAILANGRGETANTVQLTEDFNPAKAVSLFLRYRPNALPGFGLGASAYFDKIPADASVPKQPNRALSMREYIYGGHIFYVEGAWELITEAAWIIHDDRVAGKKHRSVGGYAQLAYRFDKLKPYYRFDWLSIASSDPFYGNSVFAIEDTRQHTAGLRFDAASFVAFKLEYVYRDADSEDVNSIALQASFAF